MRRLEFLGDSPPRVPEPKNNRRRGLDVRRSKELQEKRHKKRQKPSPQRQVPDLTPSPLQRPQRQMPTRPTTSSNRVRPASGGGGEEGVVEVEAAVAREARNHGDRGTDKYKNCQTPGVMFLVSTNSR